MLWGSDDEDWRRKVVYLLAKDDVEAGLMLDLHPTSFRAWRRRRGLPAKVEPRPEDPLKGREDDVVKEYLRGGTDAEIAARLGCESWNVLKWRQRSGFTSSNDSTNATSSEPTQLNFPSVSETFKSINLMPSYAGVLRW